MSKLKSATLQRCEEMAELKKLLLDYRVLEAGQVCSYFYGREEKSIRKMLSYMKRAGQLATDLKGRYVALNQAELRDGLDHKLIASFWVLLQFVRQAQYHTRSTFPSQIFLWMGGTEHEIVYVALGDENLVNAALNRTPRGDVKYFVVVEQPEQLEVLDLPNVEWFCTVGQDGQLQRYIQEE